MYNSFNFLYENENGNKLVNTFQAKSISNILKYIWSKKFTIIIGRLISNQTADMKTLVLLLFALVACAMAQTKAESKNKFFLSISEFVHTMFSPIVGSFVSLDKSTGDLIAWPGKQSFKFHLSLVP